MLFLFFMSFTAFIMTLTLSIFDDLSWLWPVAFGVVFLFVGGRYKPKEEISDK